MATWTPQQLRAYEDRRRIQNTKPEPVVRHEPLEQVQGKEEGPARALVRIKSFRTRLLDIDNLCAKYLLDGLRYSGILFDDSPEHITLEVSQEKVNNRKLERTEIEIIL